MKPFIIPICLNHLIPQKMPSRFILEHHIATVRKLYGTEIDYLQINLDVISLIIDQDC